MEDRKNKRRHDEIGFLGLRGQATAVGLIQLAVELRHARVLDDLAIGRIKEAIADDLTLALPHHMTREDHQSSVRSRLDRLFGEKP